MLPGPLRACVNRTSAPAPFDVFAAKDFVLGPKMSCKASQDHMLNADREAMVGAAQTIDIE